MWNWYDIVEFNVPLDTPRSPGKRLLKWCVHIDVHVPLLRSIILQEKPRLFLTCILLPISLGLAMTLT